MTEEELLKIPKGATILTEEQMYQLHDTFYLIKSLEKLLKPNGKFLEVEHAIFKTFEHLPHISANIAQADDPELEKMLAEIRKVYYKFIETKLNQLKQTMIEKYSVVVIKENTENQIDSPFF